MKIIESNEIPTPEILIAKLEELNQSKSGYVFRGQPNSKFCLIPNAFRADGIRKLSQGFPLSSQEWSSSNELLTIVPPAFRGVIPSLTKLTLYIMQYNLSLVRYVAQNEQKFDTETRVMYAKRGTDFWCEKRTFLDLFTRLFMPLIARVDLQGNILNCSNFYEGLAGYDETLPQHYDVPTASLDWTRNLYTALYFSLQNIPAGVSHISIYAYREINRIESNPIVLTDELPECRNERVKAQEGLFSRFRAGIVFLNYFVSDLEIGNGKWLTIEDCVLKNLDNFELIKFNVPVSYRNYLSDLLIQKRKTKRVLFPDLDN